MNYLPPSFTEWTNALGCIQNRFAIQRPIWASRAWTRNAVLLEGKPKDRRVQFVIYIYRKVKIFLCKCWVYVRKCCFLVGKVRQIPSNKVRISLCATALHELIAASVSVFSRLHLVQCSKSLVSAHDSNIAHRESQSRPNFFNTWAVRVEKCTCSSYFSERNLSRYCYCYFFCRRCCSILISQTSRIHFFKFTTSTKTYNRNRTNLFGCKKKI